MASVMSVFEYFKTDINAQGKVVFVADTVKSNPKRLNIAVGDMSER
jgi:hypothetical protein